MALACSISHLSLVIQPVWDFLCIRYVCNFFLYTSINCFKVMVSLKKQLSKSAVLFRFSLLLNCTSQGVCKLHMRCHIFYLTLVGSEWPKLNGLFCWSQTKVSSFCVAEIQLFSCLNKKGMFLQTLLTCLDFLCQSHFLPISYLFSKIYLPEANGLIHIHK